MRGWLAGLAAALLSGCAPEAGAENGPNLRDSYVAAVRSELPDARIEVVDELTFIVRTNDGSELTVNADNLARAVAEEPQRRSALIQRFARSVAQTAAASRPALEAVVAVVRTESWVQGLQARRGFELLSRPLVGDLVEVAAFNTPDSFQYGSRDQFLALAGSADVWAAARRNAQRLMGPLTREPVAPGVESVFAPETDLASSLLLSSSFCRPERRQVVLVVERGLLIGDGSQAEVVAALRREAATSGEPESSGTLVTCVDGALAVL